MTQGPGFLLTIVAFALAIGPLIFLHEMGHYLAGRLFGTKIDAFSIGFGPEIAGRTDRHGTRWKLSALPLGGYVKFSGDMNAASEPDPEWLALPPEERAKTLAGKPVWQRAIIVAAGPVTNFIIAILILAGFALAYGKSETPAVVGSVVANSAAMKAGLQPGDRITALNDRAMGTFDDMPMYVLGRAGERVSIAFDRGGQHLTRDALIGSLTERDKFGNVATRGLLGIGPPPEVIVPVGVLEAPVVATQRVGQIVRFTAETLWQLVSGHRSIKDMRGPVGMAQLSGETLTLGADAMIGWIAMLSINLGFINLLPVPVLDGGHLLFYAIEAVQRRPVGPLVQEWAFRGGLAAILALMLVVTFNDIASFSLWKNLAG